MYETQTINLIKQIPPQNCSAAKSNSVTSTVSDDEDDTLSYFSKLYKE